MQSSKQGFKNSVFRSVRPGAGHGANAIVCLRRAISTVKHNPAHTDIVISWPENKIFYMINARDLSFMIFLCHLSSLTIFVSTSSLRSWRDSNNLKSQVTHNDEIQEQFNDESATREVFPIPNAVILSPEGDEAMLTENGALSISIQVSGWMAGVMTVHVNESLVAETKEGHSLDPDDPPQEFTWELYGPRAFGTYTTRVSFHTYHGGQVISLNLVPYIINSLISSGMESC